jgi:hypothetical protein
LPFADIEFLGYEPIRYALFTPEGRVAETERMLNPEKGYDGLELAV